MRLSWIKSLLLLGSLLLGAGVVAAVDDAGEARVEKVSTQLPSPRSPAAASPGAVTPRPGRAPALSGVSGPAGLAGSRVVRAGAPGSAPASSPAGPPVAGTAAVKELVFRLGWGQGPQELGYRTPEEAAPEGPMSFALGPGGSVWVLDQVNFRVQVVERGRVVRSIPLLNDTYQDLAVDGRGRLALVDRLALRHVAYLGGAGQSWRFADIEGSGLPEGGGVTALFLRPDGVWLEWSHSHLVRVTDPSGLADSRRPIRWGRFTADGRRLLRAARAGGHGAILLARDARGAQKRLEVLARPTFGRPLTYLTALDSDAAGRVVLGARLVEQGSGAPFPVLAEEAWALVIGPGGVEERRVALPVSQSPAVPFQSLRVAPDGAIYHLTYEERGASLWRVRP